LAAAGHAPGARQAAASWVDAAGRFWLLGGSGADSTEATGSLSDLASYDLTTNLWAWVSGSNLANANGVYGGESSTHVLDLFETFADRDLLLLGYIHRRWTRIGLGRVHQ
jgi:hypothetical protein